MQRVNSASQVVLDDMSNSEDLESDSESGYYNARPLKVSDEIHRERPKTVIEP